MKSAFRHINKQLDSNKRKNLYYPGATDSMKFVGEPGELFEIIKGVSPVEEKLLLDYSTDKALETFCRINQYYSFGSNAREELKDIYEDLFSNLKAMKANPSSERLRKISGRHYERLKQWLCSENAFSEILYSKEGPELNNTPCSEYSPDLQLEVLGIDPQTLMEPVLDIGCGINNYLMTYLKDLGLDIIGIDRFANECHYCFKTDWLEYNYGISRWGSIISNMSFSNHFVHHHQRENGNFIAYARKYMEILNSLKPGGSFYYAPSLPFIEKYLDAEFYFFGQRQVKDCIKVSIVKRTP